MTREYSITWERKRKYTFIAYTLQFFAIGMDQSASNVTLWNYLSTWYKLENPELLFGIINSLYYFPTIFFSMVIARFADRTRRITLIILTCNFFGIFGCFLYVIPTSPIFAAVGRFFIGFISVTRLVARAEVARSYPPDEMKRKIPVLMASYFLGYALGPIVVNFLQHVDVVVFSLRVTIHNVSGIISLIHFIVSQTGILFLASDLSKEYDLKEATGGKENRNRSYKKESFSFVLKKVVQTFDVMFIMLFTIVSAFCQEIFSRSFPVIITLLSFPYYFNTIFYFAYSVMIFGIIVSLTSTKLNFKIVYICGLLSVVFDVLAGCFQTILIKGHLMNIPVIVTLTIFLAVCVTIAEMGEQIFLVIVAPAMVASKHQTFVESMRINISHIGVVAGCFVCGYLVKYCYTYIIGLTLLSLVVFVILIARRKSFINPEILI